MSNLSVNTITDASGGSTASINGLTPQASNMQPHNLIINGAMTVAQRGTSSGTPATNNYILDRFSLARLGGYPDNATQSQDNNAPNGFSKSFKIVRNSSHTLTGTNASVFYQVIEGQNMAYLNWGTSAAQPVTVSFWVKSNQTGSFPFIVADAVDAYDIGKLYTISLADTWEYKTITIDGPTVGTFNTDNTAGAYIYWGFGAIDAARTAQGTTWGASNSSGSSKSMVTGASTALATTSGATFYITGVQLEAGSTASPFAHENYADTLQKCQRYYYYIGGGGGEFGLIGIASRWDINTASYVGINHPQPMRGVPSLSYTGDIYLSFGGTGTLLTSLGAAYYNRENFRLWQQFNHGAIGSQGQCGIVYCQASSGFLKFDAEL